MLKKQLKTCATASCSTKSRVKPQPAQRRVESQPVSSIRTQQSQSAAARQHYSLSLTCA